jgi:hypothetical protein
MPVSKAMAKVYRQRVKNSKCHKQTTSTCSYLKKSCNKTKYSTKRHSYCRKRRNTRRVR